MGKVALIDEWGSFLAVKDGRFQLKLRDGSIKWDVSPVELDVIVVAVEGCSISAAAVNLACKYGIDFTFLNREKPVARLLPASYGSTMRNWLLQLQFSESKDKTVELAKSFIEGKLHNQRMVLAEYSKRARASGKLNQELEESLTKIQENLSKVNTLHSVDEVLSIEAHGAKAYWKGISSILPPELKFESRYTRSNPPPNHELDPFNIALNIGYSVLKREVWRSVFLAGLNPYVGFLHKPRPGRMSLVFDLMEEFRPISVDRPLIGFVKKMKDGVDIILNEEKRFQNVWKIIVEYMKTANPPHTALIVRQARKLVKHLRGTDRYTPYKSRW